MNIDVTPEERAYLAAPVTDAEYHATLNMPRGVARGWIIRKRATELAQQRQDKHDEKVRKVYESLTDTIKPHA